MNVTVISDIPAGSEPLPLPPEEQARADLYALIASLLLRAPDAALLSALAGAGPLHTQQADSALGPAWETLRQSASLLNAEAVQQEFDALFISIGTPPINPYGSYYLAGFMMEKPLAALRGELALLGLARRPGVGEPEDHLGALCEVMRLLIAGGDGVPARAIQDQRRFFIAHISPWYERCLDDIRKAREASFYRHVADFAQAFFEIEYRAFDMEEAVDDPCEVE
jgi:TorA maturation chaperone TorD